MLFYHSLFQLLDFFHLLTLFIIYLFPLFAQFNFRQLHLNKQEALFQIFLQRVLVHYKSLSLLLQEKNLHIYSFAAESLLSCTKFLHFLGSVLNLKLLLHYDYQVTKFPPSAKGCLKEPSWCLSWVGQGQNCYLCQGRYEPKSFSKGLIDLHLIDYDIIQDIDKVNLYRVLWDHFEPLPLNFLLTTKHLLDISATVTLWQYFLYPE